MTKKNMRRLEQLEASVAGDDERGPVILITFVSPDGSSTTPKTLEELKREFDPRGVTITRFRTC